MKASRRQPAAVLFDLWGTLIRSEGFDPVRGNEAVLAFAENRAAISQEDFQKLSDEVVSSIEPWEDRSRLEFTEQSLLRILQDSLGLRFRRPLQELEWVFFTSSLRVSATDGVASVLEEMQRRGIRMCVVSNSSFTGETLGKALETLGIRRFFEFVVSSSDYGVRKPEPSIFRVALGRLSLQPSEAWFVGDNLLYDVVGPLGVGMFPVRYLGAGGEDDPAVAPIPEHVTIDSWAKCVDLLGDCH